MYGKCFSPVCGTHSMLNTIDSLLIPFPCVLRVMLVVLLVFEGQRLFFLAPQETRKFLSNQGQSVSTEGVWTSRLYPRQLLGLSLGNCWILWGYTLVEVFYSPPNPRAFNHVRFQDVANEHMKAWPCLYSIKPPRRQDNTVPVKWGIEPGVSFLLSLWATFWVSPWT